MTQHKPVIIFDFDGTLADTAPMIRRIYAEMAARNNWTAMTDEDYARLRRGSLRQARKWAGVHWWQFPLVVHSAKKLMKLEAEKVRLFPDMPELVRELDDKNYELYVLSRNTTSTIAEVLRRYKLNGRLTIIHRRKRFLGSKTASIKELISRRRYPKSRVWMVGDEVRDIQAAHRAGVQSIGVSWGIQDISILKLNQPTHMVETVAQLRDILLSKDKAGDINGPKR